MRDLPLIILRAGARTFVSLEKLEPWLSIWRARRSAQFNVKATEDGRGAVWRGQ